MKQRIVFLFLLSLLYIDKTAYLFSLYQEPGLIEPTPLSDPIDYQLFISILVTLIPVVLAFSFLVFVLYRQRRESYFRHVQLEMKLEKTELEMKALRAQVNPHFIFNCLNSILHFIHKSQPDLAELYLTKFSRLIRLVLENSTYRLISLTDDMEALELYMQLEQLRLGQSFDYIIDTTAVETNDINIPPLLIQPFIENSIWHGLANRPEKGNITIVFQIVGGRLKCIIEDNGISRKKVHMLPGQGKTKSMGLDLIRKRIDLYQDKHDRHYFFEIFDREDQDGKRVELILPYE